MRRSYVLVKDHLEQANAILKTDDVETKQLRRIVQMTIDLIDRLQTPPPSKGATIIDFMQVPRRR
jgi:hypothetical protein